MTQLYKKLRASTSLEKSDSVKTTVKSTEVSTN